MKHVFNAIAFVAFCAINMPAWAVNKCTGADGKVSFQDAPCEDKQSKKTIPLPTAPKVAASKPRPPIGDPAYEKESELAISKRIDAYAKSAGVGAAAAQEAFHSKCGSGSLEPRVGASAQWIKVLLAGIEYEQTAIKIVACRS